MEEVKCNSERFPTVLMGKKDGKYLVKFPFLEVPVEVGDNFYKTFLEN